MTVINQMELLYKSQSQIRTYLVMQPYSCNAGLVKMRRVEDVREVAVSLFYYESDQTKLLMVRACAARGQYKFLASYNWTPHTYLDGVFPFKCWECGPWGPLIARRPCPQGESVVCMGVIPHALSKYFPVPLRPSGWVGSYFCQCGMLTLTLIFNDKFHIAMPVLETALLWLESVLIKI